MACLKLLLDNVQLFLGVPYFLFLVEELFRPVLLLVLCGQSLLGGLRDSSLEPGVSNF